MAGAATITVRCSCGKKLKAPAASAGKKARCPACGGVLVLTPMEIVPVAAVAATAPVSSSRATSGASAAVARSSSRSSTVAKTTPAPAPHASVGIPPEDDGLGAMYELAEQGNSTATPDVPHCPSCLSPLEDAAVLCTNCGYDTRTGKSLATRKEAPVLPYATPKGKGKTGPIDMMAPQRSFVIGLLVASGFGVVCSILWIVVAVVTGYEIGILATVVGWTVGLGMQIGQKGYSRQGSIAAAIIAVLAITLPKLLLLALVVAFVHNGKAAEIGFGLFPAWTVLWIILGTGAAFRTANGSSK